MNTQKHLALTEGKTYFIQYMDINFEIETKNGAFKISDGINYLAQRTKTFYLDEKDVLRGVTDNKTSDEYHQDLKDEFKKQNKTITKITHAPLIPFTNPANINLKDFIDAFLEDRQDGNIKK